MSGLTSTKEIPRDPHVLLDGIRGAPDRVAIIPVALVELQVLAQRFAVHATQLRVESDLCRPVALALVQGERQEESGAIGRQLGADVGNAEVGVAVLQVEAAQQLLVEVDAGRIVFVGGGQEAPPGVLAGVDDVPEAAFAERVVADKGDVGDERTRPVADLEDDVDAVLALPNDLRRDHRGEPAALGVGVQDALPIGLGGGRREHRPRAKLHHVLKLVVALEVVALEGDAVDQRIFDHLDHQRITLARQVDVLEQASRIQRLQAAVDAAGIPRVARPDQHVGQDGAELDALIALNLDRLDRARRGNRRGGADTARGGGARRGSR